MIRMSDGKGNVSYDLQTENSVQQVLDYWTDERRINAIPADMFEESYDGEANTALSTATDPAKPDLTQMPYKACGKLYYVYSGKNYVASAELLCKKNLLLTAAHCIQKKDTGDLAYNFLFCRCYDDGKQEEKLLAKKVALKTYWHDKKDYRWDYGFIVLTSDSNIDKVLTYSTDDISREKIISFGYPTNYYDGKSMVFVEGTCRSDGNSWIMDGNKMGKGCSGGAWVIKDEINNNVAVSVNSTLLIHETKHWVKGPKFDENFVSLYEYAISL